MALIRGVKDEITMQLTAELEADNGKTEPLRFEAVLQNLDYDAAQAVLREIANRDTDGEPSDETLVRRYLRGGKIPGADGGTLPLDGEVLDEALRVREIRAALVEGMITMLLGRKAMESLRRKN
jgi:hypothetical protein